MIMVLKTELPFKLEMGPEICRGFHQNLVSVSIMDPLKTVTFPGILQNTAAVLTNFLSAGGRCESSAMTGRDRSLQEV
jgi:hypothetical protein